MLGLKAWVTMAGCVYFMNLFCPSISLLISLSSFYFPPLLCVQIRSRHQMSSFLIAFHLIFLRQSLSLNMELINSDGLAGQWDPGNYLFWPPTPSDGVIARVRILNLGPHVCTAGSLLAEPVPQPLFLFFFSIKNCVWWGSGGACL